MLKVNNLSISFGDHNIFNDVNFVLNDKEKIGLIGKNGSGKSTLLQILTGKIEADTGKVYTTNNYIIGYLQQHLNFSKNTVIEEVCSILTEERIYEEWKADMILSGLGFSDVDKLKVPETFSGGYQIKINLAKMLLSEPHLLLLDEPTNYLDIHSIRWLRKFLCDWQGEIILVTHDREFMDSIISHTLFIHRNEFRKMYGNTEKIYAKILQEEELYEKQRVHQEKKTKKTKEWIDRFRSKSSFASRVQSRVKMLEKIGVKDKLEKIADLNFDFNYQSYTSKENLLLIKELSFGYSNDKLLFQNLSFRVRHGDKICIIGSNGTGKTTLLNLIYGNIKPSSGTIQQHEKTKSGYFGQSNIARLDKNKTIYEEMQQNAPDIIQSKIRSVCGKMLFSGDIANKKISILSGGEKSRVTLGKIILNPTNMLLLDEPTNHLDMQSCEALLDAVENFVGAVLMITHDEGVIRDIATKLIIFDNNKVFFFDGNYNDFLKKIGWTVNV